MATRNTLTVDDAPPGDDIPSKDGETQPDKGPKKDGETQPDKGPKKLKKGWKDPNDPLARGKFKMASGNICEHM